MDRQYYVKSLSNNLNNENIKSGVSREMIFQKQFILTFFPTVLKCPKIAGANSLFFKIAGAKAPREPVLNTIRPWANHRST